jgi:hypothetical protein
MYCDEFDIESMKNKKYNKISKGATFRKSRKIGNFKPPSKMKKRTLIGTRTYDGRKMFLKEVA